MVERRPERRREKEGGRGQSASKNGKATSQPGLARFDEKRGTDRPETLLPTHAIRRLVVPTLISHLPFPFVRSSRRDDDDVVWRPLPLLRALLLLLLFLRGQVRLWELLLLLLLLREVLVGVGLGIEGGGGEGDGGGEGGGGGGVGAGRVEGVETTLCLGREGYGKERRGSVGC